MGNELFDEDAMSVVLQVGRSHSDANSLPLLYYNFCGVHQTTRVTPAMAGVTDKLMELADIVWIVDAYERGEEAQTDRKFGGKSSVGPISKGAHTYE
jgi:hypothetical protein